MVTKGGAPLVFQLPHQRAVSVKNANLPSTATHVSKENVTSWFSRQLQSKPRRLGGGGGVRQFPIRAL